MKLLGSLLASALLSLGVKSISPIPNFEPQFRGPTPARRRKPGRLPYGIGLVQPQRRRDQKRMEKLHPLRDEHGAYTLVGQPVISFPADGVVYVPPRRKWLAGISAQRGF